MKNIILLGLAAVTFGVFGLNFASAHYDGDDYWCDEYWQDDPCYHHYDHYWAYYPHGYYCVYYVWYHPWWWDWYWYRCHWCHHWDWYFFGAGYYVVWYEGSHWYWRPRYGRYVRYELPYGYNEFRYKAREYGHNLPDKPPRQIDIPYNEKEVMRLTKEKDPELYKRLDKEQKSGNLEKMRKDYEVKQRKEIEVKNDEYRLSKSKVNLEEKSFADQPRDRIIDKKIDTSKNLEDRGNYSDNEKSYNDNERKPNVEKRDWSEYYEDEDQNKNDQGGQDQEEYDKPDNRKPERDDSYERNDDNNSDREKGNGNDKARNNRSSTPDNGGNGNSDNNDGSGRDRSVNSSPRSRR